jgi:hypothetical protein
MQKRFWPLLIVISVFLSAQAQAKMYKWTDEKGEVHYGDSMPAQYLKKEHSELNQQGLTVKQISAEDTDAQRAEKARHAQMAKEKADRLAEEQKRDRVLLDTYTTERDLVAARDARFEAVDSQIHLSESIISDSQKKLDAGEKLAKSLKAQGKPIPESLEDKIKREQSQIATQEDVKQSRVKQRKEIADQFNGYIARFRVLKVEQAKRRQELENGSSSPGNH